MRDDFACLILTHGRPENVRTTINALKAGNYSGKWYLICDSGDSTVPEYRERWGNDRVIVFDKDDNAQDMGDNGGHPGVVVHARNAVDQIAADLGLKYFLELDDDYSEFSHRVPDFEKVQLPAVRSRHLDDVFTAYLEFLETSNALTVAMAQGGDFLGGINSDWHKGLKRKAMNTFFVRVGRPINFVGRINEDTNTYVYRGSQGELFLTTYNFAIAQMKTQQRKGGLTEAYLDKGTYLKSFYSVLWCPSAVDIVPMGGKDRRIHHRIHWNRAVPKIVSDKHRKDRPSAAAT